MLLVEEFLGQEFAWRKSMTSSSGLDLLKQIIQSNEDLSPRIDPSEIKLTTKFSEDMGFDSMAMMSLVYELQDKYPDLDESEVVGIESVEGLIKVLEK